MEHGHFTTIDPDECRTLLRQAGVGRLAWAVEGRVHLLPVTCTSDGETIWYRTSPGSPLAGAVGEVVFEIDDLDDETRTGWSVVARGVMADSGRTSTPAPEPWAPGERELGRAIRITEVSGRSVAPGTERDVDVYA
ncbi:pyridoxamine 5'-phosphate oxidase family protein [Aestuariimicrobium kwangyangense]|uniref:pyridoxamine 5'-phosphate oxidase family protein n=1 Tax=Aestuariimicrobium kwangyangense TaxID=396389 RepID=UPI0003B65118|nr:pyridoxamine 5'-phosphate oxidase family protein [Aestuariimicrobium kwangyangense]